MKTLKKKTISSICILLRNLRARAQVQMRQSGPLAESLKKAGASQIKIIDAVLEMLPDEDFISLDETEKDLIYFALATEIYESAQKTMSMDWVKQAREKMEENQRKSALICLQDDIGKNA